MGQTIHLTDTRTFRHCRRAYRYSNIDRITKIRDTDESTPLTLGTAGHKILNAMYANEPFDFNHCKDGDERGLLEFLIGEYQREVFPKDKETWQVASNEQQLTTEIDGTTIIFTLDLLVLEKYYWGVDHKFLSRFPDERNLDLDDQMTGYIWALRRLGLEVRGMLYNVLLKKQLSPPNFLKDGGPSRAATTLSNTTYELYREAIRVSEKLEDAYADELNYLKNRESVLFRRYPVVRSKHELSVYEDNLRAQLADMGNPNVVYYPNPHYNCYQCEFSEICKTENEGADTKTYIGTIYRHKETDER